MKITAKHATFLSSLELFSHFDDASIQGILKQSRIESYAKNDSIFAAEEAASHFYIIVSGWVKLFRETREGDEMVFSVLTNGEMFGKTAMLEKGVFAYHAQAASDTTLMMIPSHYILKNAKDKPPFQAFLTSFIEAEVKEADQRILEAEHLVHMNSAERVGCFLLKLCGEKRIGEITLTLPYEKLLIANRLGMSAETFSRSLMQLKPIGVTTDKHTIYIQDINALQTHVCDHCSALRAECGLGDD